jgi:predicted TIM-barrel fold metal-dependent hydrolase
MSRLPAATGTIDVHAHYVPPLYRDELAGAELWMIGGLPVPEWSVPQALEFMDAHGIAAQLLSISDPGIDFVPAQEAPELARECNDFAARTIAAHPHRFGAFAVLPLGDVQAARVEAVRALDELQLDGVGMLSSCDGRYPGDPAFEPLLSELDARSAWVFVHPTAPVRRPGYAIPESIAEYPFDTTRAIISLLFNGAFARHPNIRWHFAHGGGTLPMHVLRLAGLAANASEFGNVLGLPAGSSVLDEGSLAVAIGRSFFDTALVAHPASLDAVARLGGPARVVFGSDWPFAARLYADAGEPQPVIDEIFGPDEAADLRRNTTAAQFPRLASAS